MLCLGVEALRANLGLTQGREVMPQVLHIGASEL